MIKIPHRCGRKQTSLLSKKVNSLFRSVVGLASNETMAGGSQAMFSLIGQTSGTKGAGTTVRNATYYSHELEVLNSEARLSQADYGSDLEVHPFISRRKKFVKDISFTPEASDDEMGHEHVVSNCYKKNWFFCSHEIDFVVVLDHIQCLHV